MKKFAHALPLAALMALGANAQSVCPTETVVTVTGTVTETYCPDCGLTAAPEATGGTIVNVSGPNINITGPEINVNLYVFPALGASGLTSSTYTVTEACPCTDTKPPGYIPPGFTTSVLPCDVCGEATPTVTLTCPEATPTEWTTYTTAYPTPCATGGFEEATYTVTEPCPCTAERPAGYVPSGFTTSAYTVPGSTPVVTAITCPVSSAAASIPPPPPPGNGSIPAPPAPPAAAGSSTPGSGSSTGEGAGTNGTTPETWTGTASSHTQSLGIALITISAVVLAAAIGF